MKWLFDATTEYLKRFQWFIWTVHISNVPSIDMLKRQRYFLALFGCRHNNANVLRKI